MITLEKINKTKLSYEDKCFLAIKYKLDVEKVKKNENNKKLLIKALKEKKIGKYYKID